MSLALTGVIFLGTVWACSPPRRIAFAGYVTVALLGLLGVQSAFAGAFITDSGLLALTAVLVCGSLLMIFAQLLHTRKTSNTLLIEAIFGYCLIALVYALLFARIEAIQPGAFQFPEGSGPSPASFLYLSIVTITRLGYGEITPQHDIARIIAGLEAMTGTLFVAIFIGRIVGNLLD